MCTGIEGNWKHLTSVIRMRLFETILNFLKKYLDVNFEKDICLGLFTMAAAKGNVKLIPQFLNHVSSLNISNKPCKALMQILGFRHHKSVPRVAGL